MNASAMIEDSEMENDGLHMEGILGVTVFYITDDEHRKYEVLKKEYQLARLKFFFFQKTIHFLIQS